MRTNLVRVLNFTTCCLFTVILLITSCDLFKSNQDEDWLLYPIHEASQFGIHQKPGLYQLNGSKLERVRNLLPIKKEGETIHLFWVFGDSSYVATFLNEPAKRKMDGLILYINHYVWDSDPVAQTSTSYRTVIGYQYVPLKTMADRVQSFSVHIPPFPDGPPSTLPVGYLRFIGFEVAAHPVYGDKDLGYPNYFWDGTHIEYRE